MRLGLTFLGLIAALGIMAQTSVHAGPPTPGGGDHCTSCGNSTTVPTWPTAPKACLPDRAVRWDLARDMEPCHCPPQEMCPDPVNLTPADLEFIVRGPGFVGGAMQNMTKVIQGTAVGGLQGLLNQGPIGDMDALANIMKGAIRQAFNLPARKQNFGTRGYTITVVFKDPTLFIDWVMDTLDLPLALAINCCDSPCPAGLVPVIERVDVEIDRVVGGNGSVAKCNAANVEVERLEDEIEDAEQAVEDAKDEKDAVCSSGGSGGGGGCTSCGGSGGGGGGSSSACDDAKDDLRDAEEDLARLEDDLKDAKKDQDKDCDIPEVVTETVTMDTLQCQGVTTARIAIPREGCLIAGTQILMADGSSKSIEDLQLGDVVKSNVGKGKVKALSKFTQQVEAMYSINGDEAFFTIEHPVLTKHGWKSLDPEITSTAKSDTKIVGKLEVGDRILTKDGDIEVKSIEKHDIEGGISAYNISVEGDGSFIANGIIMKSFTQMQMHY